jgi:hypothetical protein
MDKDMDRQMDMNTDRDMDRDTDTDRDRNSNLNVEKLLKNAPTKKVYTRPTSQHVYQTCCQTYQLI